MCTFMDLYEMLKYVKSAIGSFVIGSNVSFIIEPSVFKLVFSFAVDPRTASMLTVIIFNLHFYRKSSLCFSCSGFYLIYVLNNNCVIHFDLQHYVSLFSVVSFF